MSVVSMKALLEAGVHFGHRTRRWNPKMRPFIFTERSKIHIIDLQQTVQRLNEYHEMVRDLVARGGTIMFVGTKRQAQATIRAEAERCNMPYVNIRWLGGTLTNWVTIKQRIDYLLRLERRIDAGEFRNLSKKEQLSIQREVDKLNRRIGGLKTLTQIPDMVFVVDTNLEDLSVKEASKLGVPILGVVDTNSDPDPIDYVIPSNDDAIRAVKLIVSVIADAVIEGLRTREIDMAETGQVSKHELAEMEKYLGPSTMAKLQTSEDDDDDDDDDDYDYDDEDVDDEESDDDIVAEATDTAEVATTEATTTADEGGTTEEVAAEETVPEASSTDDSTDEIAAEDTRTSA